MPRIPSIWSSMEERVKKVATGSVGSANTRRIGGHMRSSPFLLHSLVPALCLSALGVLGVTSPVAALDCGSRLVAVGDGAGYVRGICGEPEMVSSHTESRTDFVAYPGRGVGVYGSSVTVNVQIDVWVYDFGSTRFMEELTFANGVLRALRPLGYGSVAGNRRRRDSLAREGALLRSPARLGIPAILADRRDALARA